MGIGFAAGLTLYLAGFAFFTYGLIIADPTTSPLARFLTIRLPNLITSRLTKLLGPKLTNSLAKLSDYAFVVIYLVVVLGSWSIMFTHGYEFISRSDHVPNYHKVAGYGVFVACVTSWRSACLARPGTITARTLARYDHYPPDGLLFPPGRICPTVGIRKLPRSKFDRVTGKHVPRFDHFCGWLNNAVGEENYRNFLAFLVVHVAMCWYGVVVCARLFRGDVVDHDLYSATFFVMSSGEEVRATHVVVLQYLMARHFYLSGVFLIMAAMAVVLTVFLAFHLYITARGMTTNEYFKWRDVRKWHRKAKRRFEQAAKEGRIVPKKEEEKGGNGADGGNRASSDTAKIVVPDDSCDVGCAGPTAGSPSTPTRQNGKDEPQPIDGQQDGREEQQRGQGQDDDDEEEIVDPGPFPRNIYDRGLAENFGEVFHPRSQRRDAMERWAMALRRAEHAKTGTDAAKSAASIGNTDVERRKPKAA